MTKYFVIIALWFSALLSFSAVAQTDQNEQSTVQRGEFWFDQMAQALRGLNFEATLVKTQGQRIIPLRWLHGSYDHKTDLELLVYLNDADERVLRIGDQTYYYSPTGAHSYTLQSDVTFGLIPAAFYRSFAEIKPHYQVLASGGKRVTGRLAQYLRLISRDDNRYHYDLWLDPENGMLLKFQMLTPQGDILEQMQVTSIAYTKNLPDELTEISNVQRPPKLYERPQRAALEFSLRPQWLPLGFKLQRAQHRTLINTQLPTDYYLYTDGLTEVSIYVTQEQLQQLPRLALQGPDSIVNTQQNGFAVTVVGKLPAGTLMRIADSMSIVEKSQTP